MAAYTDTASAPTVYMGTTDINGIVNLDPGTGVAGYTYSNVTVTYEIRGLADTTAAASATYHAAQANTSAIATRTSEAGLYKVVYSTLVSTLTPDT